MSDVKKLWATQNGFWTEQAETDGKPTDMLYPIIGAAVLALMGLLLPRAILYDVCAPLGVSLASAVTGPLGAVACLFGVIGYLLPSSVTLPLRYIVALSLVFGIRWAMSGVKRVVKTEWYAAFLSAVTVWITGMAVNSAHGFQWDIMFAQTLEALLGGGFAYFYRLGIRALQDGDSRRTLRFPQQTALVILTASLLMALDHIVIGDVSVGRIVTMALILFAAKSGQEYGGMLSGVVLGATTVLCMPTQIHAAVSYAVGGLFGGIFSRFGRVLTAFIFGAVHVFILFSTGDVQAVAIGAYEWLAATVLFLILPMSMENAAKSLFCRAESVPAVEGMKHSIELRLQYAADTMCDIAKTVDTVSEKLAAMEAPKLKTVYTEVCEHICNGCAQRDGCWKEQFTDTMADFRAMGRMLREKGRLEAEDMTATFTSRCRHHNDVRRSLNTGYRHLVSKEEVCRRLEDMRGIVTDQFEGIASMLQELSHECRAMERTDEQAAANVERICRKYRWPIRHAVCLVGRRRRLSVEILAEGTQAPSADSGWFEDVCAACGCDFEPPIVSHADFFTKVCLKEKPRMAVRMAKAQCHCRSERFCGDALESFYDQDGRFCVVLSDGMGSGGRAAVDGALTSALASRMLQAGFHFDNVLRMINSAMLVKSGEESSATLDALQIDLFTGTVNGVKAGAAPTFLCSRGHVCRIHSTSLPIGILPTVDATQYEEYVVPDDLLVMVSDGVVADDSEWLESIIERAQKAGDSEQALANDIVYTAVERQGNHSDDTTAVVMRIC